MAKLVVTETGVLMPEATPPRKGHDRDSPVPHLQLSDMVGAKQRARQLGGVPQVGDPEGRLFTRHGNGNLEREREREREREKERDRNGKS